MRPDERARSDRALQRARTAAYPAGEFVGQESFLRASDILSIAAEAGVAPGVSVLDLCCGVAGPGRLITRALGCSYTGVDVSPEAIAIARERAGDLDCRFRVARIPPVPSGPYDVVLLLETMLAFADKTTLLRGIAETLRPGGRFACTLEEGPPLTEAERESMPAADTVWLTPLPELLASLDRAGLHTLRYDDCSRSHRAVIDALVEAFAADASEITRRLGRRTFDDLLTAHRLWRDWLRAGRVRKFIVIAERTPTS